MGTITVRGRGIATAQPDDLTVGLTVEALRSTASEAFAEATRLATSLVALCDQLGVPTAARSTSRVSLAEHGEHTDKGWRNRGYRATSRLAVRLADAELASRLVSEAAGLEARIDGPAWRVAPDNAAHAEARRLAACDARAKAQAYADALGSRLGVVESATEPDAAPPVQPVFRVASMEVSSSMPLEAGEHEVAAQLDVTFQLEEA